MLLGVVYMKTASLWAATAVHLGWNWAMAGLFALMYGTFRVVVEFVREPDAQLGYLAFGWLTMGQVLSVPLILLGLFWLWKSHASPTLHPAPVEPQK